MMKPTTTVLLTVSLLAACTTPAVSPLTEQNPSTTTASSSIDTAYWTEQPALLQRPLSIALAV